MTENTIAVGLSSAEPMVCIYARQGNGWAQQGCITGEENGVSSIGTRLALEGDTLVIGAVQLGEAPGRVHVFERSGTVWSLAQVLSPELEPVKNEASDVILAMYGATLLVGAMMADDWHGELYIYQRGGSGWALHNTIRGRDLGQLEAWGFAHSLATDGERALVAGYDHTADQSKTKMTYSLHAFGTFQFGFAPTTSSLNSAGTN